MKTLRNLAARGLASMSIKLMAWAVNLAPESISGTIDGHGGPGPVIRT